MTRGLMAVPNSRAWPGTPPTTPDSTVSVIRSEMPSSAATLGIIAEMPTPRLTTSRGRSSKAARRRDHPPLGQRIGRDQRLRHARLAAACGVVGGAVGLHLIRLEHDVVDQEAGDLDHLRMDRAALDDALHLADHGAAGIVHGLRDREILARRALMLHADIAVLVGRRAADDRDVRRGGDAVEQPVLAVQLEQVDQRRGGAPVHAAAVLARVHIGVEADMR